MSPRPEDTLEEIWEIRRQIAKEFNSDPGKKVEYYQQLEKESGAQIFNRLEPVAKVKKP
jgi:hypothetical protein